MRTVIDKTWFTTNRGDCIGIVAIKNDVGEVKFYIGTGAGINEDSDAEFIADNG